MKIGAWPKFERFFPRKKCWISVWDNKTANNNINSSKREQALSVNKKTAGVFYFDTETIHTDTETNHNDTKTIPIDTKTITIDTKTISIDTKTIALIPRGPLCFLDKNKPREHKEKRKEKTNATLPFSRPQITV